MKQRIKLTESALRNYIKESVREILHETSFDVAGNAYKNWLEKENDEDNYSPAFKRRLERNPDAKFERGENFRNGMINSFNREYGHNLNNVPKGSDSNIFGMDVDDKEQPHIEGTTTFGDDGTPGFEVNLSQLEKGYGEDRLGSGQFRNYKHHSHYTKPTKKGYDDWEEDNDTLDDELIDKYNKGREAIKKVFKY